MTTIPQLTRQHYSEFFEQLLVTCHCRNVVYLTLNTTFNTKYTDWSKHDWMVPKLILYYRHIYSTVKCYRHKPGNYIIMALCKLLSLKSLVLNALSKYTCYHLLSRLAICWYREIKTAKTRDRTRDLHISSITLSQLRYFGLIMKIKTQNKYMSK